MSTERIFQIERFYFGNLIQNGEPIGKPAVLARSANIDGRQIQEILKVARVKPPELEDTSENMPSTLGLFKDSLGQYVVVKSQRTTDGFPQLLYLIVPDLALRWLAGNFSLFESFGYQEMKSFAEVKDIKPLMLEDPQPFSITEQQNLVYDLYMFCGDQLSNVAGLIASLVHGVPIAMLNAPPDLHQRLAFIQALLTMLPAPARTSMTWVSNLEVAGSVPALISFVNQPTNLEGYTVYDWATGALLTDAIPDKYSKFIVSQMRLDASLVVEATAGIARTAVWRAMRKESLPEALHFASRRAAIDAAVAGNQPADLETVAAILRQDPTLSPSMRMRYAQHLLTMTLALGGDFEHTDAIPLVAAADRSVAESVYFSLKDIAEGDSPLRVIPLVERWLTEIPQGRVIPWQQLAHIATLTYLRRLLDGGDTRQVFDYLAQILGASPALKMEAIVPDIVRMTQPAAAQDPTLAVANFLLGAEYLSTTQFAEYITPGRLVKQLPTPIQRALYYLQPSEKPNPPAGVLLAASQAVDADHRLLLVGRLAELALYHERENLLDARTVEALLRAAKLGSAQRFETLIQYILKRYTQSSALRTLDLQTLELLPNLHFSLGQYDNGVRLLDTYQNHVFTVEHMTSFIDLIGNVFLNGIRQVEALEYIFGLIEHSRLRMEPRARALCAVLIAGEWGYVYRNLARRLVIMLYNDIQLVNVIGIDHTLRLLAYHVSLNDEVSIGETGAVLLEVALELDQRGVELIWRVYELLQGSSANRAVGFELIRRFVRLASDRFARYLPDYFGQKLGDRAGKVLHATYVVRRVLGGQNLVQFAESLQITSLLLMDIAATYHEAKENPPPHRLRAGLDSMSGGLVDSERDRIGDGLASLAEAIFTAGNQQDRGRESQNIAMAMVNNELAPRTAIDFMLFMGGIFSRRQWRAPALVREGMTHPFGERSATMLLQEIPVATKLFTDLLTAFPPNEPPELDLQSFINEIDNLWQQISLYNQRQIHATLASYTQYFAQLVTLMAHRTREKVFTNRKLYTGEQVPKNEIEALRWISGYFNRAHPRQ